MVLIIVVIAVPYGLLHASVRWFAIVYLCAFLLAVDLVLLAAGMPGSPGCWPVICDLIEICIGCNAHAYRL